MASVLYPVFVLSVAAVVAVSSASVGVLEAPEARADGKDGVDIADAAAAAEETDLVPELCGPNGDLISCILGAFLGDTQLARGYQRFGKKMILPLLVGILLKVASFVPLILGKLSLLALVSIVASKLALVISAIVGTKRLYSAGHMAYGHPSHHDWAPSGSEQHLSYAEYPHAAHSSAAYAHAAHAAHAHRRVVPSVASSLAMGRSLDSWSPYHRTVKDMKADGSQKEVQSNPQSSQSSEQSTTTQSPTASPHRRQKTGESRTR